MEFKPVARARPFEFAPMRLFSRPLEVPHRLRAIVRARESSVIVLAVVIGAIAGLAVAAMGETVGFMHQLFFGLDPGERLSGRVSLDPLRAFVVPSLGGLLFGSSRPSLRAAAAPKSTRSRPTRCTAAACRCAAA